MIAFHHSIADHTHDEGVQLMLQLQAGDQEALAKIAEMYQSLIASIVHEKMGQGPHVDDVIQDVLLRVFKARDQYEPTAKLSTWICLITRNLDLNRIRDNQTRRTYEFDYQQSTSVNRSTGQLCDSEPAPDAGLIASETKEIVEKAMNTLIPRQRQAIDLFYFQGLSYSASAQALETTPTAVKALLVRARSHLRTQLADSGTAAC